MGRVKRDKTTGTKQGSSKLQMYTKEVSFSYKLQVIVNINIIIYLITATSVPTATRYVFMSRYTY